MRLKIEINIDNDVFVENGEVEITHIIKRIAQRISTAGLRYISANHNKLCHVNDTNGNRVGSFMFETELGDE